VSAYYNEHDPFAAAWLRELIADGLIALGEVDERSIEDVLPSELAGFVQCHFFAGIGVWSLALRQAGWRDDEPIWTGSCPCQPFSAAGKGGGFADERHLWPAFHWLIEQCRPELVVGEQVASKDGLAWLDLVSADVEASGFAFGAVDTCAAGFGAPHIRQRLYWMADAGGQGEGGRGILRPGEGIDTSDGAARERSAGLRAVGGVADGERSRLEGHCGNGDDSHEPGRIAALALGSASPSGVADRQRPGTLNGLWRAADWLCCTDGKWRPVAPGTFPLAPGGTVRNRVGQLRGAGNAINLAQAQGFIEAVMDVRRRSIAEAA
jgi:DNA (cytosine-5)-methyltransferase 1